jgi:hypothetical protein
MPAAVACLLRVRVLQQSLNMLQGETKPIRRHIEARFDEIKSITESSHPYLDMELSSWWVCQAGRVCWRRGGQLVSGVWLCWPQTLEALCWRCCPCHQPGVFALPLPPHLARLQNVTWVCRQEVTVCPAYVHRRLQPLLQSAKAAH